MHKDVKFENVLEGGKRMKEEFPGIFNIRTKFISGYNDTEKNIDRLRECYISINPTTVEVMSINPNEASEVYEEISQEFKELMKEKWSDISPKVRYMFR